MWWDAGCAAFILLRFSFYILATRECSADRVLHARNERRVHVVMLRSPSAPSPGL